MAILGDLAGIQKFVLRPVPGAGGAARRLRARSFRVSALSELIANRLCVEFSLERAFVFYSAGGHFLIAAEPSSDWPERLQTTQRDLDQWLLTELGGEVLFHLAGCEFHDGRMPGDLLNRRLRSSRQIPLRGALQRSPTPEAPAAWNQDAFFRQTSAGAGRCAACARTVPAFVSVAGELMCESCAADTKLGGLLAVTQNPALAPAGKGPIHSFRGPAYQVCAAGQAGSAAIPMHVVRWMPRRGPDVLSLEDLANLAPGDHKWLGYLRMDADNVGHAFRSLDGSPVRTFSLSRFLDIFFTDGVQELISTSFPYIYPVYGGGDDLFVIGPWHHVVDFAAAVRYHFWQAAQGHLTLSAGLALAKAHEHILSGSRAAAANLAKVKAGKKNGFCLFGEVVDWEHFSPALDHAITAARWARPPGVLPKAFLHRLLGLHAQWRLLQTRTQEIRAGATLAGPRLNSARVRPLLNYHIERNIRFREQREWAKRFLNLSGPEWLHAGFIARYAVLASGKESF